ncbi:winged helix-turn-helix domain-containing protein [Dysgonomonas alginatilytica]|uniref:winged helix-turn-helix domain-containing protein n=1 Tax=Dysgonomonas alginatilytica TaxID=1605892 RepID=UPI00147639C2
MALESNTPCSIRDKIIEQIGNNSKITRNESASILGITSDGVKYHLQKMTAEGLIFCIGSARDGFWESYRQLIKKMNIYKLK